MNFKPLNNKGMPILVIILIVAVISGIAGAVYLLTLNKSMPSNPENKTVINLENKDNDCSKDEDEYGCESLKFLNKGRAERGLSEITEDDKLCNLAKNISELISAQQDKLSSDIEIGIFLQNLINDKKFDYLTIDNVKSYSQANIYGEEYRNSEVWGARYDKGLGRYDRGCIRYSEVKNKKFNRVVLLLESESSK